ncbi:MAG TPA: hypothetical protein VES42_14980, partial [Pilimelia sp.]|nr:hypothetical protein [Pilimelia sp.]
FLSWALLDGRTGAIAGSANLTAGDPTTTVRAWLAADYLRVTTTAGRPPSQGRLARLRSMLRDGDTDSAQGLYRTLGADASLRRMAVVCGLTDSRRRTGGWSDAAMSARDGARLGWCLADGRAAGPRWTPWLLAEMRHAGGDGDFGVRTVLPPDVRRTVAVENGWLGDRAGGRWHVNCLAIGRDWTLSVLTHYPRRLGLGHGRRVCRAVGADLIAR